MHTVTVGQLNSYIKNKLDADINLSSVCVRGEISNFKHHYSGHMYMSLKDETGSVKAVMFRSNAASLKFGLKDGMNVLAVGRVSVYERDGAYQLYIDTIIPDGIGQLYAAYEQLKKELESNGYFDDAHKKDIPNYPQTIGVVTASTGAAVRDIINVIKRRYPVCDIKIYPAQVQGIGAKASICEGIEYFNSNSLADVLIVGRGGGSIEDLWAFNEREVAMAIYNSRIPVISAVGHETDFTIADFVADRRAPTPSAAAEIATPDISELKSFLTSCNTRLVSSLGSLVKIKSERLMHLTNSRVLKDPLYIIASKVQYLDDCMSDLKDAYERYIEKVSAKLSNASYKLGALNPVNVLSRGYSVAEKDGRIIRKTADANPGDEFILKVSDGQLECKIKE